MGDDRTFLVFKAITDPEDAPDSGQPLHMWEEVGVSICDTAEEALDEAAGPRGTFAAVAADDFVTREIP